MRLGQLLSTAVLSVAFGGCINGEVRNLGGGQLDSSDGGAGGSSQVSDDAAPGNVTPPASNDASPPNTTVVDAGRSADAGQAADAGPGAPDAAPPACAAAAPANGSGHHNPGAACLPCHNGSTATKWTVSGTLYADANGATALPGATILVTDGAGKKLSLVTASNGNFYTATAVTYPLTVSASKCPAATPMLGTVAAPGSCNASGCHSTSGMRIHLP